MGIFPCGWGNILWGKYESLEVALNGLRLLEASGSIFGSCMCYMPMCPKSIAIPVGRTLSSPDDCADPCRILDSYPKGPRIQIIGF